MCKLNKPLCILFCAALLAARLPAPAAAEEARSGAVVLGITEVPLYSDGDYIGSGIQVEGITYVPLLTFTEHMLGAGCDSEWDGETETARISAPGLELSLRVGSGYMTANGRCLYFEEGVYNVNGTIIVPIRELAKVFSLGVAWDGVRWAIHIDEADKRVIDPGEEFYDETALYWLSRVIFSESGTQPLEGQIGVGNVVLNRLNDEYARFGDTIVEVIFQEGQFDVARSGAIYAEPSELSTVAAKLCLEGYNTVGESKWFLNPRIGIATWMRTYKALVCSIADHEFYA